MASGIVRLIGENCPEVTTVTCFCSSCDLPVLWVGAYFQVFWLLFPPPVGSFSCGKKEGEESLPALLWIVNSASKFWFQNTVCWDKYVGMTKLSNCDWLLLRKTTWWPAEMKCSKPLMVKYLNILISLEFQRQAMHCSGLPARKKPCSCPLAYMSRESLIFQLFVIVAEKEHGISSLACA